MELNVIVEISNRSDYVNFIMVEYSATALGF